MSLCYSQLTLADRRRLYRLKEARLLAFKATADVSDAGYFLLFKGDRLPARQFNSSCLSNRTEYLPVKRR